MKRVMFRLLNFFIKIFLGTGVGRVMGVMSIYEFIFKLSKPKGIVLINCQENKMFVNADDNGLAPALLTKGVYEPFETELLKKLLKRGMAVVNVGANIGYYTLITANYVGPNGKVYAFEPEPKNYELLVRNIEENGYKNVLPIQAAVSNKKGAQKLFLDKSNLGNPSLAKQNIGEKSGFVEVETNSLDNFLKKYNNDLKVDLIQMDTQGSEGLILDGAKKIIGNNKLKIIMEFWPYGLNNMGTDALGLLKRLENYGFKIGLINEVDKCISYWLPEKIVEICKNSKNGKGDANLLLEK